MMQFALFLGMLLSLDESTGGVIERNGRPPLIEPDEDELGPPPRFDKIIWGSESDDLLIGTREGDLIYGLQGRDDIYGGKGNDRLHGGSGDDDIHGGEGNDSIDGDEGDDRIHGNEGDDIILGHGGDDQIYGGEGSDLVLADIVLAGEGKDLIVDGDDIEVSDGFYDRIHARDGDDGDTIFCGPEDIVWADPFDYIVVRDINGVVLFEGCFWDYVHSSVGEGWTSFLLLVR